MNGAVSQQFFLGTPVTKPARWSLGAGVAASLAVHLAGVAWIRAVETPSAVSARGGNSGESEFALDLRPLEEPTLVPAPAALPADSPPAEASAAKPEDAKARQPDPPPVEPVKVKPPMVSLGIPEGLMDTSTWIGYRDAVEGAGQLANIDQAAMTFMPLVGHGAAPGEPQPSSTPLPVETPTPPSPPTPAETPQPAPTAPPAEPVLTPPTPPAESTPPTLPEPAPPAERPAAEKPIDTPSDSPPAAGDAAESAGKDSGTALEAVAGAAKAIAAALRPEAALAPDLLNAGIAPTAEAAARAAEQARLNAAGGTPTPPPTPAVPEPKAATPQATGPSGAAGKSSNSGGLPGEVAQKESPGTSTKRSIVWQPGRPAAAKGIDINTTLWKISDVAAYTLRPRNPLVEITFGKGGKVTKVAFAKNPKTAEELDTGFKEVNEPILDALYQWTISEKSLAAFTRDYPEGLTVSISIILTRQTP